MHCYKGNVNGWCSGASLSCSQKAAAAAEAYFTEAWSQYGPLNPENSEYVLKGKEQKLWAAGRPIQRGEQAPAARRVCAVLLVHQLWLLLCYHDHSRRCSPSFICITSVTRFQHSLSAIFWMIAVSHAALTQLENLKSCLCTRVSHSEKREMSADLTRPHSSIFPKHDS